MPPGRNAQGQPIRYVPRQPNPFQPPADLFKHSEPMERHQPIEPQAPMLAESGPHNFPPYPLTVPGEAYDLKSTIRLVNAIRLALLASSIVTEEKDEP